jgi:hypothetical protein
MTYQEKSIHYSYCETTFTFTVGEQEFYASKGLTNEPKRCAPCRSTRDSRITQAF